MGGKTKPAKGHPWRATAAPPKPIPREWYPPKRDVIYTKAKKTNRYT